jgi:hypothetical protein
MVIFIYQKKEEPLRHIDGIKLTKLQLEKKLVPKKDRAPKKIAEKENLEEKSVYPTKKLKEDFRINSTKY